MRSHLLACSTALVSLAACAGPQGAARAPGGHGDEAAQVSAFQGVEGEVMRGLAAIDRRVASRARLDPREADLRRLVIGAMFAEDTTVAIIDGTIDPFSFEARARALAAVKTKLATAPAHLPASATGMLPAPALEKELLGRLVDEELVRLEEERMLPRSASALVRGVVETWSPPATPQQGADRDRWLARRLSEVRASVAAGAEPDAKGSVALDVVRARELDDALDALERAAVSASLVRTTAELVKLREALEAEANRPAAPAQSDWSYVTRRVRAHLGLSFTPEALDTRLASLEQELRAAAEAAIAASHLGREEVASNAAPLVFASAACTVAIPGSPVRSMSPPPERAAACRLRQTVLSASDARSRAFALVAMHDHVVVARWALDVARGAATIAQATARHHPMSQPDPDVVARWERVALAQPTAAIGGGLAAGLLSLTPDLQTRARAWAELGEVPLDIAERELGSREPRDPSAATKLSASTPARP